MSGRRRLRPGQLFPFHEDRFVDERHLIAPHRIVADGRVMYGTGERVPWADAVKYGLVADDVPASVLRLRPCANCATPSDGWWCSTECRRAEDGDERDRGDDDAG